MHRTAKLSTHPMLRPPAFASIEILGLPPLALALGGPHAERVLGLLLLCICLASSWQFWMDNERHSVYQQGVRAATMQDWAAAQAAYRAAAGYADADMRAAAAGQLVAEQSELVRQAARDRRRCDGTGLARVAHRLQAIAPHAAATTRFSRVLDTGPNWVLWCHPEAAGP